MAPGGPAETDPQPALKAAEDAYRAGNFADAARLYARVVAADGKSAMAWFGLGNARWRRGDRAGAIEAYRRAVTEDPRHARTWHNLSTACLASGRNDEASTAAERAVALAPERAASWNNLAAARFAAGDAPGAEAALRRAVQSRPDFAVAWSNLGNVLLGAGRPPAAADAFRRALDGGEKDPPTFLGLSTAQSAAGDLRGAEATLAEGVRVSPGSAELWIALGDARRRAGNAETALSAYEAAAAAASDSSDEVRGLVARRTLHGAAQWVHSAVARGDVGLVRRAAARLASAAREVPSCAEADGAALSRTADLCVAAARASHRKDLSPEWVEGILTEALRPARGGAPSADGNGRGSRPTP
jgi:tetratricopeptide (TPR) repeat protein